MPDHITRLLDQIDRQSIEARRYPESAQFEELLEHTGQLAQAVKTILSECESFEVAHDDEDNPFHQGVRWTVMAIRQAITDAIGDHDDD